MKHIVMKQTLQYILSEVNTNNNEAQALVSKWDKTKTIEDSGTYIVLIDKVKENE